MKLIFALLSITCLFSPSVHGAKAPRPGTSKPNLVIIFLDDSGYGDVIMEIDWSVGEIMRALRSHDLEEDTLVLFSSDNGPWAEYGDHAGTTPFREHKATGFDGGIRSATIVKFPRHLEAASSCDRALSSLDVLPTLAHLTGAVLPDNEIDGRNAISLFSETPPAEPLHDYLPFSTGRTFEGIISGNGRWKLHLPHSYRHVVKPGQGGEPGRTVRKRIGLSLFDLHADPGETTNVLAKHPEVANRLETLALAHRKKYYRQ